MKFLPLLVSACLATKFTSLLVTIPDQFDFNEELIDTIHELDGKITHEFTLFKGFTVDLPNNMINVLKDINGNLNWGITIEEDTEVHTFSNEQHIL